jgi:hypothetical protein
MKCLALWYLGLRSRHYGKCYRIERNRIVKYAGMGIKIRYTQKPTTFTNHAKTYSTET